MLLVHKCPTSASGMQDTCLFMAFVDKEHLYIGHFRLILLQVSLSDTVRLNTRCSGVESLSGVK